MSTQVSILGNLGRDAEMRNTANGTLVTNFSVASNTVRNSPEGQIKQTDWYNVSAFGRQAEILAKYLKKGSYVLVRGRLTLRPWIADSGEPRVSADVLLQDFEFIGNGNGNTKEGEQSETPASQERVAVVTTKAASDAPFPTKPEAPEIRNEPDEKEKEEMLAATRAIDHTHEEYAGQF